MRSLQSRLHPALQLSPESTDVRSTWPTPICWLNDQTTQSGCAGRRSRSSQQRGGVLPAGLRTAPREPAEPAAEAFQQSWKIDPAVPALDFQTGMAQEELGQIPDAIRDFENVIRAVPTIRRRITS